MIILGIHDGHNASAALMIDGKIIAVICEERFTYKKNEMGFPEYAIRECLKIGCVAAKDIDEVAFSTISLPLHYLRVKRECLFTVKDYLDEQEYYWKPKLFQNQINTGYFKMLFSDERFSDKQAYKYDNVPLILDNEENKRILDSMRKETLYRIFGIDKVRVVSYDHHTSHKYYAYFASPFRDKKTLIFTADGGGDGANGTLSMAQNNRITELGRNNITDLGRIYRYITLILGMKIAEHEYKVMGLAPYASEYEIRKCDKAFKNIFHVPDFLVEYKNKPKDLYFHFRGLLEDCRFDGIAGAVQNMIEQVAGEWFKKATEKFQVSRVVFSGGLSMNVKLNKIISELDTVNEFYCPASGGDESLALGACYIAATKISNSFISSIEDIYLGPAFSHSRILNEVSKLKNCKIQEHITNKDIAKMLANNIVVGRFAGRMEFGARALGNRSILASPKNVAVIKKINQQIKFRDFWMPFAPSILDKFTDSYIINPKNIQGDHMTVCFDTTELGRKVLAAAIHPADYTVRAHIVKKHLNPGYYDLIESFMNISGIGALLNTSFNLHGYPIVCTPEHAVHVFENSSLDAMVLEDIAVVRNGV